MNAKIEISTQIASRGFRIFAGLYFGLTGFFLVLSLTLGAPSFWYWVCGLLWFLFAIGWFFEPVKAAAFSLPPVAGMAIMMVGWTQHSSGLTVNIAFWIWLAVIAIGLGLVLFVLVVSRSILIIRMITSLGIIAIAFYIDKTYMNQLQVVTYEMNWSADGNLPWGYIKRSSTEITVYRRVNGVYCYDYFHSEELKKRLLSSRKSTVIVQYNQFSDFGDRKSYNVKSIDGVLLQDADKTVKDWWAGGGRMQVNQTSHSSSTSDCP